MKGANLMPTVTVSCVIDAPASEVWKLIRDFNGLPSWHPRMVESHIEGDMRSDQIGCVRNFTIDVGGRLREKLLALSDCDCAITYTILETPAPITNHIATLKLTPVTEGSCCFAEWTARFDCAPEKAEAQAKGMATNVFQRGFNALKKHFNSQS